MATLTIHQGQQSITVHFDPPMPLAKLLSMADSSVAQPCGGRGICGKCAVTLSGEASAASHSETSLGVRLACQAVITGDAQVILPTKHAMNQIEGGSGIDLSCVAPMTGRYGAAVDIGTTTIAILLYDLRNGHYVGSASMLNPQTSVAADVIGRINAALHGQGAQLQQQVLMAIQTLLVSACAHAQITAKDINALVLTGNTTMLYLLTGRDPSALSHAPFIADCLFGLETDILDRKAYLPDCLHAFVGADTTCAILASGMMKSSDTALLCDVGTNGELALWHSGNLYIASTAAGPAFEGAGIKHGCSSVSGAIDRVSTIADRLFCHTIDDQPAIGICGSGLIGAIAALLDVEAMDETGYMEEDAYHLRDGINITQADIRAVQLAKAAICAGITSLLSAAECSPEDVSKLYLAGGFGSHLNIRSAVRIGLIPQEMAEKVDVIGNAALDGAALLLMDTSARNHLAAMRSIAKHVRLDGNPEFSQRYIDAMMFPE